MITLDLCIIIFLIIGGLIGYKQGFTRALVNLVGYILIIVLSFILKNPVSEFMMMHFPFFDFYGLIKGASVLDILVYEVMAFGIVFSILLIVLKLLMFLTSIFEKLLSMTIILGLPSKILGCILGVLKNYIFVFAVLFVLSLPNFSSNEFISNSSLREPILEKTPVLSLFTERSLKVFNEFSLLKDKYVNTESSNEFNYETLDLFLKYDIVRPELVEKLLSSDKLHIKGAEVLVENYKES